jgi:mitogen-activated protein kinase 1/3
MIEGPLVPDTIQNAAILEQAQMMQESATPMPTPKPHKSVSVGPEDFSEWAVGTRYQLIRMLGRGSYGEVAQAQDSATKQTVAIKRITSAFDQEVDAIRLYREIHILRQLRGHDCIINLIDVVEPPNFEEFNDLYLVFECKCRGS